MKIRIAIASALLGLLGAASASAEGRFRFRDHKIEAVYQQALEMNRQLYFGGKCSGDEAAVIAGPVKTWGTFGDSERTVREALETYTRSKNDEVSEITQDSVSVLKIDPTSRQLAAALEYFKRSARSWAFETERLPRSAGPAYAKLAQLILAAVRQPTAYHGLLMGTAENGADSRPRFIAIIDKVNGSGSGEALILLTASCN